MDYAPAVAFAGGRTKPVTDDEIRHGVMHAADETSVAQNVREGSAVPEETAAESAMPEETAAES